MTVEVIAQGDGRAEAEESFAGRIDVLYTLGRPYLSLPFAVLCVPAPLLAGRPWGLFAAIPLLMLTGMAIAARQLTGAYRKQPQGRDPHLWARRYTLLSAVTGAVWGVGVLFWFTWGALPAQAYLAHAYLALAYLGMTATEFITRSAHRPAYAVHTMLSLGPLIACLVLEGGLYADMTALVVGLFGAVLISYCNGMARLIEEGVLLRNQNAALVARLSDEKADALAARDAAEVSTHVKSAFIANISHELRTPLNALLGMAQLLERAELPKAQAEHVKVMLEAGRGLQTLLDDVIALTRDDGPQDGQKDCDPAEIARTVVRLLKPRAFEKKLQLTLSAPDGLPRVAADPRRLRQALLKLVDNALKFTERGLIEVGLEARTDNQGHGVVRFSVTDTGSGLDPGLAAQLFEPFSPGDRSYARKEQGAGLGLAVARRIVEQAGGRIGAQSRESQGAQFWFTLPVSGPGTFSIPEKRGGEPAVAPHGLSFLLMARPQLASQIENILEPFGNRIAVAASVAEAARYASRERFDAIIAEGAFSEALAPLPDAVLIAILGPDERAPAATDHLLRWPAPPAALYRLIEAACAGAQAEAEQRGDGEPPAIDAVAFASLERSVGIGNLIEILQCYSMAAEQLTAALQEACAKDKWDEAARLAQDIVGAAGGLGLAALTRAARLFAQKRREGESAQQLRHAAQMVVGEHVRARRALANLYPDMA